MARKTYQGVKNNKSRTMAKLIQAVGIILKKEGYTGLTVGNVAREAGVDRKLISNYFGTLDHLIETYIKNKDYWSSVHEIAKKSLTTTEQLSSQYILENFLLTLIDHFSKDEEMQHVVLWQISEQHMSMSHLTQFREKISAHFFPAAEQELKDSQVDIRAISSILAAGIYYLVLHTKTTTSTFCEIDLTTDTGMDRIKNTIKQILKDTYS